MSIIRDRRNKIPPLAITMIAITGAFVVIGGTIIGYKIIKKITTRNMSKDLIKDTNEEIHTNTLSYSESEYQSMADSLFRAMDGLDTDWNIIKSVIVKLKTKSDWYMLIKDFGVKETTSWLSSFKGNLIEWLADELNSEQRKFLTDRLKIIGVIN